MRWPRFLLFNAAGGIVWAALLRPGRLLPRFYIDPLVGPVGIVFLVLAVLLIIAGIVLLRCNEQRLGRGGTGLARPTRKSSLSREGNVQSKAITSLLPSMRPGMQCEATGRERCHLLAADFPRYSRYTERCDP